MASDVRECDVCRTVFKIDESYYYTLTLPDLEHLDGVIENMKDQVAKKDVRAYVGSHQYDLCNHCILHLCEVLQGLYSIREEKPQ